MNKCHRGYDHCILEGGERLDGSDGADIVCWLVVALILFIGGAIGLLSWGFSMGRHALPV